MSDVQPTSQRGVMSCGDHDVISGQHCHVLMACIVCVLFLCGFAQEAFCNETPKRLKPGETIRLTFEELGPSWHHGPFTQAEVYLPVDYDQSKPSPLLVWFADDVGSHDVALAKRVTGGRGYVCLAVPYLEPAAYNRRNEGGWHTDWSYYKAILEELERTVPNIDPDRRVVVGYGSGAYSLTWHIAMSPDLTRYFSAFALGGGGSDLGRIGALRGKPLLLFVGEHDQHTSSIQSVYNLARKHKVRVEMLIFHNAGEAFPEEHYTLVRHWLNRNVRHPWLASRVERIEEQVHSGLFPQALPAIRQVLDEVDTSMPEYIKAEAALQAVRVNAKEAEAQLLASNPSPKELKAFITKWEPCKCTTDAEDTFNQVLATRLQGILSMPPQLALPRLRGFLVEHKPYPVYQQALAALDDFARPELKPIMSIPSDQLRAKHLKYFIQEWKPAPLAKQAQEERNRIAQALLDDASAIPQASLRNRRVRAVIRQYSDTLAAERAKEQLSTRTTSNAGTDGGS